jgi:hypothetical protein
MNRIGPKVQSLIDNQNITQGFSNSQRKKERKKVEKRKGRKKIKIKAMVLYGFFHFYVWYTYKKLASK